MSRDKSKRRRRKSGLRVPDDAVPRRVDRDSPPEPRPEDPHLAASVALAFDVSGDRDPGDSDLGDSDLGDSDLGDSDPGDRDDTLDLDPALARAETAPDGRGDSVDIAFDEDGDTQVMPPRADAAPAQVPRADAAALASLAALASEPQFFELPESEDASREPQREPDGAEASFLPKAEERELQREPDGAEASFLPKAEERELGEDAEPLPASPPESELELGAQRGAERAKSLGRRLPRAQTVALSDADLEEVLDGRSAGVAAGVEPREPLAGERGGAGGAPGGEPGGGSGADRGDLAGAEGASGGAGSGADQGELGGAPGSEPGAGSGAARGELGGAPGSEPGAGSEAARGELGGAPGSEPGAGSEAARGELGGEPGADRDDLASAGSENAAPRAPFQAAESGEIIVDEMLEELSADDGDMMMEMTVEVAPEAELEEVAPRAASEAAPPARARRADSVPPPPPRAAEGSRETNISRKPPPAPARAAAVAAVGASPQKGRRRAAKHWFEDIFDEDYLRTLPFLTPKATQAEAKFVTDSLALEPGGHILDVGCGYGRHAMELAARGYYVVGLDNSLPLLLRGADEAQRRGLSINFVHGDMREMNFEAQFDGAYCLFSSFGFFDDETNKRTAQHIARALKPGARFVVEVLNRDYLVGDLPSRVWWEGDGCVVLEEVDFNYYSSRISSTRSIVFDDGRQLEQAISMRSFSLHELGKLLHSVGFRVTEISGSMATRGRFFGAHSRDLVVVAERRAGKSRDS